VDCAVAGNLDICALVLALAENVRLLLLSGEGEANTRTCSVTANGCESPDVTDLQPGDLTGRSDGRVSQGPRRCPCLYADQLRLVDVEGLQRVV